MTHPLFRHAFGSFFVPLQPNGVLSVVLCVRRKDIIMKASEMNKINNTGTKAINAVKKYTDNVIIRMSKLYPNCVGGQENCLLNKGTYAEMLKYEAADHAAGVMVLPLDSTPTVIINFADFYPATNGREEYREVSREEYNLLMALKMPYVVEYRDCGTSYKVVVRTKDFYPFLCSEKEYTELDGKTYETLMSFKTVSNI